LYEIVHSLGNENLLRDHVCSYLFWRGVLSQTLAHNSSVSICQRQFNTLLTATWNCECKL
jgi:hypothetical protein